LTNFKQSAKQGMDALNAVLTYFGMDEDEWNKGTFDQVRAALKSLKDSIEQCDQYKMIPLTPTSQIISAMAGSKAVDDEGEFPCLFDLIDFSGENKTNTVLVAAYKAIIESCES